ncbi:MAG: FadR/GntR family transcriptional regulator [Lachnospiraceae bacterium]|nr:FadR/GntR family transcriptional regulator [Lachnospiraceae bacterium]
MGEKESVTGRIIVYIRDNIRNGSWKVGEKLPSENEMCKLLNVSRTSVRSALQQFIALGILESVHGKGTFLLTNDLTVFADTQHEESAVNREEAIASMKYLLEFRSLFEPGVCAKVAPDASEELIARLEELLNIMKSSVGDPMTFVKADMDFHLALCAAYHNPLLMDVMTNVSQKKIDIYHMLNTRVGYYGGIYYHSLILEAIKKHDGKLTRNTMLEHLQRSISDLDIGQDTESGETGIAEPEESGPGKDET